MAIAKGPRENPNPLPKLKVGDFVIVRGASCDDTPEKVLKYTFVCKVVKGPRGKIIMHAHPESGFMLGHLLNLGPTCEWNVEVIGRPNAI